MLRMRQPALLRHYNGRAEQRSRPRLHRDRPHPLLNLQLSRRPNLRWSDLFRSLPPLSGVPICIRDGAELRAHKGKLLWGCGERGVAVHAASFLRGREIVLRTELLRDQRVFRFILVHELFHFVWARLGTPRRAEFTALLRREQTARTRGELGESSSLKKERLSPADCLRNSRAWRDYVCESFCDTAAWLYSAIGGDAACTLAKRCRDQRARWFAAAFEGGCRC
jgi:hypothetical protein